MQEEYLALCNLYGYHAIDIPFSIEGYSKLHDEIERIKTQSKKSAEQAYIAAQQMQTARQNQTAAVASTRLDNAASGFAASSGSKLRHEQTTAQIFE